MNLANILFKGDKVVWVIFLLLCLISIVEVFSATSTLTYKDGDYWGPILRHASFLFGGALLILVIHNIPCRFFSLFGFLLPVSAVLLGVTILFGVEINDSNRWMNLFGVRFQPSEIAKLSCIVYVAFLLSRRKMFTDKQIFNWILIGISVICALILLENFSTAMILFVVCFLMMVIGWVSPKSIAILFLVMVLLGASFFFLLHTLPDDMVNKSNLLEKIKNRTEKMFKGTPPLDAKTYKIDDYNRQETHAKIAIANGGLTGKLPGLGQQRDTLPQAYSDFIYAIIIEEMGIFVGFFVLFLYIALMIRVGVIARRCDTLFPKYLVLGCGLMIVVQALTNMAVVAGLFPVTGQPLPLVSRGGTSTVITCVYFAVILSVSRFGAGMGNEEEEEEEEEMEEVEEENVIEVETPIETPV
ncbi:MAG: FtsW/RodA/SpoVE family cell cycle protein [Tannerellaceae bacterium]|jgi:cell division protein FtsW|nr:FtsW/RodA/SpoVE family cell cycle protein [Tannerellaceae bacterium]